ncbi:rCG59074 [Rattus norvegicus]|uniref:RCG59074 n=1 Tax=Rattus norvegicus TaxID=10116 RepID=A6JPW0_RAT|nr:rCG59074 [Rattus norvegicus]
MQKQSNGWSVCNLYYVHLIKEDKSIY